MKKGFSLAEALVVMAVVSIFFAAVTKVITTRPKKPKQANLHGYYECYVDGGMYERYVRNGVATKPKAVTKCKFQPPGNISFFNINTCGPAFYSNMEPNISRDIWVEVNKCIILSNDSGISYNLGCLSDNPSENLPDNEENSSDNGNSNNNLPQKEPDKKKVYSLQFYITKSNTITVVQYDGCRYGSPASTGWITYSGVYQFEVPYYANAYNALKQSVANVESMLSKCNNNSQQTGCIALSNPASRIQAVVSNWQPENYGGSLCTNSSSSSSGNTNNTPSQGSDKTDSENNSSNISPTPGINTEQETQITFFKTMYPESMIYNNGNFRHGVMFSW